MSKVSVVVAPSHLAGAEELARAERKATGEPVSRAEILRRAVEIGLIALGEVAAPRGAEPAVVRLVRRVTSGVTNAVTTTVSHGVTDGVTGGVECG